MNLATTVTKVYENQVVVVSNEKYILEDLPNILGYLRKEIHADAEVINDTVRIVCDLGIKKFEGRTLRKLIVREVKRIIREALNITGNRWFNTRAEELPEEMEHVMHA
jgi:predicted KAP-like P-loop ATPase